MYVLDGVYEVHGFVRGEPAGTARATSWRVWSRTLYGWLATPGGRPKSFRSRDAAIAAAKMHQLSRAWARR